MNIRNCIALALLAVAVVSCKNKTAQPGESEAEKAEKARKETEAKAYDAVKAHILAGSLSDTPVQIDTIIAVSMDTATERTGWLHSCSLIENLKNANAKYIKSLEQSIAVEKEIHISLAQTDIERLKNAQLEQKITEAALEVCQEKAKNADDTKYIYYKVQANTIKTKGKDTVKGTYFLDKDFKVKQF